MANTIDHHDLAAIEKLAASGLWEQAGLVEARRLQEHLKKQEILDAVPELRYEDAQAASPPHKLPPDLSQLIEIECELIGDILTLFDEQKLTRQKTLSLLGHLSVLIELVKRGQVQEPTKSVS